MQYLQKKVPLPKDPLAWREIQVDFSQCRQYFASTGVSGWFLQKGKYAQFLEIAYQERKVIPAQAPQYLQYALISDFLDLAYLSTQEEAALATNWIKDRPDGLKLQNLNVGHQDWPIHKQFAGKSNCRRPLPNHRMRIFGHRETIDLSRESIGNCKGSFPA